MHVRRAAKKKKYTRLRYQSPLLLSLSPPPIRIRSFAAHTQIGQGEEGILGDKMGKARRSAEFIARRFFGSLTSHLPSDFMFVPPPFPKKTIQRSNLISLLLSGTRALMKCCKDDPIYFCSPLLLCCQDLGQLSEGGGGDGRNRQIIFCEEADRPLLLLLLICAL